MGLLPQVGRKRPGNLLFMFGVYTFLVIFGATMIVPFLITFSGSLSSDMDYARYYPVPRYFWSGTDRMVKGLGYYFANARGWNEQMRAYFPETPSHWTTWLSIGADTDGIDRFAGPYLEKSPQKRALQKRMAMDYSDFCDRYGAEDALLALSPTQGSRLISEYYLSKLQQERPESAGWSSRRRRDEALRLLRERYGVPYESFQTVRFNAEMLAPLDFVGYFPSVLEEKSRDFFSLKQEGRSHAFTPGVKGNFLRYLSRHHYAYKNASEVFPLPDKASPELRKLWFDFKREYAPAAPCVPYALRAVWYRYLETPEAMQRLKLKGRFDIGEYNRLAHTRYRNLQETPFPIPKSWTGPIAELWREFQLTRWPMRLISLDVTPELAGEFQTFLRNHLHKLSTANALLGTAHRSWEDFKLLPRAPLGDSVANINYQKLWRNFVDKLPYGKRQFQSSEIAFQQFAMSRYGTLDAVNRAYGRNYRYKEELHPPFAEAYAETFRNHELHFAAAPIANNYGTVWEYLVTNARAVPVTVWLIMLTLIATLTINPLAAYAMSRFRMKGQKLILLFMLATMAFPAMVSAIPAYLLMRDIGLLNTFFALVLPGAANGMAIFILKGFFDSLPQELFEAATIDGASEMQMFRIIAMPLVKPILAVNCLNAFVIAYNGWEWALIICQDKSMWTIAVWMYQAANWWRSMPYLVSAGFIVTSIPTLIVFLACQKMILRGVILPTMK